MKGQLDKRCRHAGLAWVTPRRRCADAAVGPIGRPRVTKQTDELRLNERGQGYDPSTRRALTACWTARPAPRHVRHGTACIATLAPYAVRGVAVPRQVDRVLAGRVLPGSMTARLSEPAISSAPSP